MRRWAGEGPRAVGRLGGDVAGQSPGTGTVARLEAGNPFRPFFESAGRVVLDGGLATALEARGFDLSTDLWSAALLVDAPDAIRTVHADWLVAGADCITTASYQASIPGLRAAGLSDQEAEALLRRSSDLAISARRSFCSDEAAAAPVRSDEAVPAPARMGPRPGSPAVAPQRVRPIVAASVGPYGAYLADGSEYDGRYGVSRQALDSFHRRRFEVLADSGVDVLACETIPSAVEVDALLTILEASDAWAWFTVSCRDGSSLHDGTPIEEVAQVCDGRPRVAGFGVNCTAPEHVASLVARAASRTRLPLIAYPNSGERYDPDLGSWRRPQTSFGPWLDHLQAAMDAGASVIGGCCRVGPKTITELRRRTERRD